MEGIVMNIMRGVMIMQVPFVEENSSITGLRIIFGKPFSGKNRKSPALTLLRQFAFMAA